MWGDIVTTMALPSPDTLVSGLVWAIGVWFIFKSPAKPRHSGVRDCLGIELEHIQLEL